MTGSYRRGALGAVLALPLSLFLASPAGAAEPATGGTSITLNGSAAQTLKRAGVRFVAIDPATVSRTTLTLPAAEATIGTVARVRHAGVVQLVRGKGRRAKRVAITGAETRLAASRSVTSARLGTTRVPLLSFAAVRPQLDASAGTARLRASVSLTPRAARLLARRLGLKRLAVRRLGTASLAVARRPASVPVTPVPTAPGAAPAACPPAATPTANVSAASFTWRPRESFVRYINSEAGNGLFASECAAPGAREARPPSDAQLVYAFGFPFADGSSDGQSTTVRFTGRVDARWPDRGIDLPFANPQLVLGPASSASFTMSGGQVVRLLDLDPAGGTRTTDGTTETYTNVPATLTEEGAAAFNGFYQAGSEFGTVSATLTRTP